MAKVIENEYQLSGYLQTTLGKLIKDKGKYEPDCFSNQIEHKGTYTWIILDNVIPAVKFEDRFLVALLLEVYEGHESITLVTESDVRSYSGGCMRGIGQHRSVFETYDIMTQVSLTQQILGALALNDIINDL